MKILTLSIFMMIFLFVFCLAQINVPHKTEMISFQSGNFTAVGELRIPEGANKHPLVIMVHGDGPSYRTYFAKLKESMLRVGYATLMWDKPGFGESTGKLNQEKTLTERAAILVAAINFIKKHTAIDSNRIGLWGISQAGYVMPLVLRQTNDIKFMITVGCPATNSIEQTAYFIRKQLIFDGSSAAEASEAETHFKKLFAATNFQEYIQHARPLYDNPAQRKLGCVSALWDENNWKPQLPDEEAFFNSVEIIETLTIPVLAFFGEKDTQVDPFHGAEAYQKALEKAGNKNFHVELVPNADHNIILCKTGSMQERNNRTSKEWQNYAPEYLNLMEKWLKELADSTE
ncbi:alpha/beta fold hydrolase [candidate division KSB1 bacterium]|nr:alpha/beta fold hydrolase [candidate division KSB1 bacterium]